MNAKRFWKEHKWFMITPAMLVFGGFLLIALLSLIIASPMVDATLTDNVVRYYSFDKTAIANGTALDLSGHQNCKIYGTPQNVSGMTSDAVWFNKIASTDFCDAGVGLTDSFTLSFWFKDINGGGSDAVLTSSDISGARQFDVTSNDTGPPLRSCNLLLWNSAQSGQTTLYSGANKCQAGPWTYVTVTKNTTAYCIYVNASLSNGGCINTSFTLQTAGVSGIQIGGRNLSSVRTNVTIDELAIYNVALNSTAINQLWSLNVNGSNPYNVTGGTPSVVASATSVNVTSESPTPLYFTLPNAATQTITAALGTFVVTTNDTGTLSGLRLSTSNASWSNLANGSFTYTNCTVSVNKATCNPSALAFGSTTTYFIAINSSTGNDWSGLNSSNNYFVLFLNDTIAPVVNLIAPLTGNVSSNTSQQFVWNVTDNGALTEPCNLTIVDGGKSVYGLIAANGTATKYNLTSMADAIYYWNVTCSDNFQTNYSTTINITIETLPPSIILNAPSNNTVTNNITVTFTWTAIDEFMPTTSCGLYINSVLNYTNAATLNNTATSKVLTMNNDGTYQWYVTCTNLALDTSTSGTNNLTIDTTPPNITINTANNIVYSPSNVNRQFNFITSDSVGLAATGTTNIPPIAPTTFTQPVDHQIFLCSFYSALCTAGTYYFDATAIDAAGNTAYTRYNYTMLKANTTLSLTTIPNPSITSDTVIASCASTNTDGQTTELFIDGVLNTTGIPNATTNIVGLTVGSHTITCNSNATINYNQANVSVTQIVSNNSVLHVLNSYDNTTLRTWSALIDGVQYNTSLYGTSIIIPFAAGTVKNVTFFPTCTRGAIVDTDPTCGLYNATYLNTALTNYYALVNQSSITFNIVYVGTTTLINITTITTNETTATQTWTTNTGTLTTPIGTGTRRFQFSSPIFSTVSFNTTILPYDNNTILINITNSTFPLTINILDEDTNQQISSETFTLRYQGNTNSYTTSTSTGNVTQLITQPDNYDILYGSTNYPTRMYYLQYDKFTNTNYQLYALNQSRSSAVTVTVDDQDGNPAPNALVKAWRFYPANNSYNVVEMEVTNQLGQSSFHLVKPTNAISGEYYKFSIELPTDNTLLTTDRGIISSDPTYTINTAEDYLSSFKRIMANSSATYNLSYINSSNAFVFTWVDNTGIIKKGCLKVIHKDGYGDTVVGNTCANGDNGQVFVVGSNNGTNVAVAYIDTTTVNSMYLIDQLTIIRSAINHSIGTSGLFYQMLITIGIAFALCWNITAMMIGIAVSFIVGSMIGLVGWTWTTIVTIVILAGIIIWRTD
jgi:hypothetical protein